MTDLHLHTRFSHDSEEEPSAYLLAAKKLGQTRLGFSEHYDYDVILDGVKPEHIPDLTAYGNEISRLKGEYPGTEILKGIELGYRADAEPHYRRLLKERDFDYAILSVHTLAGRGDCYYPEFYRGGDRERVYSDYLNAVLNSVRSDLDFQIVGHVGYISRYSPYKNKQVDYGSFKGVLDEILREIIARGCSLEINTSTGASGAEFVPGEDILLRFLELGGKNFTFGSDAHAADKYLKKCGTVKSFLLAQGVKHMCYYKNRVKFTEEF